MGMMYQSSGHQPVQIPINEKTTQQNVQHQPERSVWSWLTHDATGFFTLFLFVAVAIQAGLFVWQLKLIERGAKDTQAVAQASRDAAIAGNRQAAVAEKQLVAMHRPWVYVESVTPAGDFVFEAGEARLLLHVVVKNSGHSPGLRVSVNVKIVASNQISLLDEQKTFATNFRRDPNLNEVRPEVTSWPGDKIVFPVVAWLDSIDMTRFKPLSDGTPFPITLLAIVGCLNYEFSFAPGHHQTALIYTLRKKSPYPGAYLRDEIAGAGGAIRLDGTTVTQNDLVIGIGFEGTGPVD